MFTNYFIFQPASQQQDQHVQQFRGKPVQPMTLAYKVVDGEQFVLTCDSWRTE